MGVGIAEGELSQEDYREAGGEFSVQRQVTQQQSQSDKSLGTAKPAERKSQMFEGKSPTNVCKEVTKARPFCAAAQAQYFTNQLQEEKIVSAGERSPLCKSTAKARKGFLSVNG